MAERKLDAVGWPVMHNPDRSHMSELDRLLEQEDGEIVRDGYPSPATQHALKNVTEQDLVPGPRPKKDYSWLRPSVERDRGPEWDDWEMYDD